MELDEWIIRAYLLQQVIITDEVIVRSEEQGEWHL